MKYHEVMFVHLISLHYIHIFLIIAHDSQVISEPAPHPHSQLLQRQ